MARLATLIRSVSKKCAMWSPHPKSVWLRAVESPTMNTVGDAGFSGRFSGFDVCSGVGGGLLDALLGAWANALAEKRRTAGAKRKIWLGSELCLNIEMNASNCGAWRLISDYLLQRARTELVISLARASTFALANSAIRQRKGDFLKGTPVRGSTRIVPVRGRWCPERRARCRSGPACIYGPDSYPKQKAPGVVRA